MNYQQALDYMFSQLPMFHRVGAPAYKADLKNTIALCELTGYPFHHYKTIHIAGTNGKGSVSHMLSSILQESGAKTGLFTSPHLIDFRERIKVNGEMISHSYVIEFIEKYRAQFAVIKPSFFEMTFALAMCWFKEQKVDYAVVETGLGGRLDSTNVIIPELSVITNIGFDHMQFLGNTLKEIAYEKAGIIKPGIPVVIGESNPETDEVFLNKAYECNSLITFADQIIRLTKLSDHQSGFLTLSASVTEPTLATERERTIIKSPLVENQNDATVKSILAENQDGSTFRPLHTENQDGSTLKSFPSAHMEPLIIESPLTGDYQEKNIATVLACTHIMLKQSIIGDSNVIVKGIKNTLLNTGFQGRWQILQKEPLTICDIGHNPHGLAYVVKQLKNQKYNQLHFVLGVVNDKDIDTMLTMLPVDAIYYYCKANIPRGLDADILKEKATMVGLQGNSYSSVAEAYKSAFKNAGEEDLIFIGGSAFVVAEVLPSFQTA